MWMNLENIIQVKEARQKMAQSVWFYLYEIPRMGESIEISSIYGVPGDEGKGWMGGVA